MMGVSQEHILSISFNYTWKVQCTEHTCMLYTQNLSGLKILITCVHCLEQIKLTEKFL